MALSGRRAAALKLTAGLIFVAAVAWGCVFAFGCAGGMTTQETAFAIRAGLVLDGDPTPEQVQGLVADALSHAEARLAPEQYEAVRVLSAAVLALYEQDGDWRAALVDMLAAIEAGGGA